MNALGAENTWLETHKESTIAEKRDALKTAATVELPTSSVLLAEELERLRQEKTALDQALQEEKAKRPVHAPVPTPDNVRSRVSPCGVLQRPNRCIFLTRAYRLLLRRSETSFSQKWRHGHLPRRRRPTPRGTSVSEKEDFVRDRDEALSQAKVTSLRTHT
jgi:hypothetical protein